MVPFDAHNARTAMMCCHKLRSEIRRELKIQLQYMAFGSKNGYAV